jgi:hypothetical protein
VSAEHAERSDRDGVVRLKSEREWVLDVPIMIHGVGFYYFAWCVEKSGYVPTVGHLSAADASCSHAEESVTLPSGTGFERCLTWLNPTLKPPSRAPADVIDWIATHVLMFAIDPVDDAQPASPPTSAC